MNRLSKECEKHIRDTVGNYKYITGEYWTRKFPGGYLVIFENIEGDFDTGVYKCTIVNLKTGVQHVEAVTSSTYFFEKFGTLMMSMYDEYTNMMYVGDCFDEDRGIDIIVRDAVNI